MKPRTPDLESYSSAVAGGFAGRWAQGVARRSAEASDAEVAASGWFVDAFAGADLQRAALSGRSVQPAAVAAVRAMAGEAAMMRIALVEEDPGLVARLAEALDGIGVGNRVRVLSDPATIAPGEIGLLEAAFPAITPALAAAVGDDPLLMRMAPLAARALPWRSVEPFAALASADLLLRVPEEDFRKQARFSGPLADYPPHLRRVVEGCSAFMGDDRNGWLVAWRAAERAGGVDAALAAMAERLRLLLSAAGEDGRIVRTQLLEAGKESVHVLLAASRPEHPLELNGAIGDAGGEVALTVGFRAEAEEEPESAPEPSPVLELFPVVAPAPEPKPRGPDPQAIADDLHARHRGELVLFRDLLASLAESGLTTEQVRAALAQLRRESRVRYRGLDAPDAEVDFLLEPALPTPRVKKPRKALPGELGLFDEG
ncbi:hypothetical protein [Longimicrobium terrae]|uniref:Uncharacterized protein n=1 Tax=Longimicrobium terrae TaxID=1639882 RepID=A0A841GXM5_9BACT|nr:hypothetical protein [Longimicrobium terrae]MBB4636097.1 hypothetical protein [Longimicrobium terrae]MBB6070492.1 hypothetical protein [Longimicrobium terrae]NNC29483.1 hypothetical protein [Longimicrobium terrae]